MALVFSLPFCLLLPDGDYPVKLSHNDTVHLNLSKVIPKIFDERLPYRGFLKGELNDISKLRVMFRNKNRVVDVKDLPNIHEFGTVIKYIDQSGNEIVPQLINNDVDINESEIINDSFKEKFKDSVPRDYLERHSAETYYLGRQVIINGELKKDRYGRFRYTKVKYTSTKRVNSEEQFRRAIKATNILIDAYRRETFEHWITNVTENEIFIFKNVSEQQSQVSFSINGFSEIKNDHGMNVVNTIKDDIINSRIRFPYAMLMLDAEKALDDDKNYLSIIYAITALESIVKIYITLYGKNNGHSETVEKRLNSMGLHLLVTTILKLFVKCEGFNDELVGNITKGITLRNKVIHESKLDVPKQEARKVIQNVREMARVLIADVDQYYNNTTITPTFIFMTAFIYSLRFSFFISVSSNFLTIGILVLISFSCFVNFCAILLIIIS